MYTSLVVMKHAENSLSCWATNPYTSCAICMMMSRHGSTFRITGPLWGESTGNWWGWLFVRGTTRVIGGFPLQMARMWALMFSLLLAEQAFDQIGQLPVIWAVM